MRSTLAFMLIGSLLSLGNFLVFAGSRGDLVAGPVVVLLQQAVLPFTMLFTHVLLQRRFVNYEYVGVGVVVVGIAVVATTEMLATSATNSRVLAAMLVLLSSIPNALALVLMERLLKHTRVDVWWLWMWVNVYEVLVAFPIAVAQMKIENVSSYNTALHDGYTQFFHSYTVVWFALFIVFVVANKALSYIVILTDSATLNWMALAAAIPLADLFFSLTPETRARDATWMWAVDIAGLIIVVSGLALYHGRGLLFCLPHRHYHNTRGEESAHVRAQGRHTGTNLSNADESTQALLQH